MEAWPVTRSSSFSPQPAVIAGKTIADCFLSPPLLDGSAEHVLPLAERSAVGQVQGACWSHKLQAHARIGQQLLFLENPSAIPGFCGIQKNFPFDLDIIHVE